MKALAEIAQEALNLSPIQRLVLARILLDLSEVSDDYSPDAAAAWEEEISHRIEAVKSGSIQSKPFEEVFADLDQRYPG